MSSVAVTFEHPMLALYNCPTRRVHFRKFKESCFLHKSKETGISVGTKPTGGMNFHWAWMFVANARYVVCGPGQGITAYTQVKIIGENPPDVGWPSKDFIIIGYSPPDVGSIQGLEGTQGKRSGWLHFEKHPLASTRGVVGWTSSSSSYNHRL